MSCVADEETELSLAVLPFHRGPRLTGAHLQLT